MPDVFGLLQGRILACASEKLWLRNAAGVRFSCCSPFLLWETMKKFALLGRSEGIILQEIQRLSDPSAVKALLARHGFTFSKSLGQNFLVNPSVCPRMAEECGVGPGVGVLEVGPGIGVLTVELAKRAEKVVSIELDKRLLPVWGRRSKGIQTPK